ncbi:MAG: hypothetical protein PHU95_02735 [Candidatus Thermoplasmatota archaeon]|nr:hypothetical protein [Candidatus Thermoplasmatota archaeon]
MCSFISDERGISEEFTSLPALAVVLIGFGLFFALVGGAYHAHTEKMERVDEYRAANFVLQKLTASNGVLAEEGILMPGGMVDGQRLLQKESEVARTLYEEAVAPGWGYSMVVEWRVGGEYTACRVDVCESEGGEQIAASKKIPVRVNAAQTVSGTFTVRVWEEKK